MLITECPCMIEVIKVYFTWAIFFLAGWYAIRFIYEYLCYLSGLKGGVEGTKKHGTIKQRQKTEEATAEENSDNKVQA